MSGLLIKNVTKIYPGVTALDDVSFEIKSGDIHCIIGENGAGKSTLMKILAGEQQVHSGEVFIDGEKAVFQSPADAISKGVGIVYQELSNFIQLDVARNLFANNLPRKGLIIDYAALYKKARKILDSCGLDYINERAHMEDLSLGSQQMVEIASLLSKNVRVVILDEPTSALTEVEITQLNKLIKDMKARGITVIYISHKLNEILYLADTITVLKDGRHVKTMEKTDAVTREMLVRYMVGRDVEYDYKVGINPVGDVLLKVEGLSSGKTVSDVSFEVRRGEIFGISGLEGSGRTELLETLFGWRKKTAGKIYVSGKEVLNRTPQESIKNGFAYITKERKMLGLFLSLDVASNTAAASTTKFKKYNLVDYAAMKENAQKYADIMKTKIASLAQKVMNLSGGNQQKVLLSMWLSAEPDILLIDEPTRGIDVGAKSEIHILLRDIVSQGKAVIMVSSEMPEIIASCDKTIVMYEGAVAGFMENNELSEEKMMKLASNLE